MCYKASINGPFFILSGDSLVSPSATYDPLSIGIPHNHLSHSSILFHIVFHQSHYPSGIKSKSDESDAFLPKSWHGGSIFWLQKPRLSRLSWGLSILFPFQHVFFFPGKKWIYVFEKQDFFSIISFSDSNSIFIKKCMCFPSVHTIDLCKNGWGCTASTPTLVSKLWLATPRRWLTWWFVEGARSS